MRAGGARHERGGARVALRILARVRVRGRARARVRVRVRARGMALRTLYPNSTGLHTQV